MPCTPLTCVSIGSATVSITVLGLAPGYLVVTETVGGTTLGYCDTGNRNSETSPISTNTIASTLERTGRSMKKRENMLWPLRVGARCQSPHSRQSRCRPENANLATRGGHHFLLVGLNLAARNGPLDPFR